MNRLLQLRVLHLSWFSGWTDTDKLHDCRIIFINSFWRLSVTASYKTCCYVVWSWLGFWSGFVVDKQKHSHSVLNLNSNSLGFTENCRTPSLSFFTSNFQSQSLFKRSTTRWCYKEGHYWVKPGVLMKFWSNVTVKDWGQLLQYCICYLFSSNI